MTPYNVITGGVVGEVADAVVRPRRCLLGRAEGRAGRRPFRGRRRHVPLRVAQRHARLSELPAQVGDLLLGGGLRPLRLLVSRGRGVGRLAGLADVVLRRAELTRGLLAPLGQHPFAGVGLDRAGGTLRLRLRRPAAAPCSRSSAGGRCRRRRLVSGVAVAAVTSTSPNPAYDSAVVSRPEPTASDAPGSATAARSVSSTSWRAVALSWPAIRAALSTSADAAS